MGYSHLMTICEYCSQPIELDEFGTPIHTTGPAAGSFICHFEGDPNCDCWECENRRLATT